MRAFVTGANGFVGRYLAAALRNEGAEVFDGFVDVNDVRALRGAFDAFRPTTVFHLAAQTFVPESLRAPLQTYETNVMGTARLADALRGTAGGAPRLVFASSAEVYGARDAAEYPLVETLDPRPRNPYAASKAAAETILLGESRSFGLDVVIARAFNHIGPGQDERFVVASFAAQLARIAAGGTPQLLTGNLEAARDFLDVRDVVAAYIALARRGERGEIYNVCSGHAVSIRDVLRELIGIARVPVEVREDPARARGGAEIALLVGSPAKLRARTGWEPTIPLVQSLRETYEARRRDAAGVRL
ncbi:MAG: GDP-mannose 4,6-dehydratase [Candidatus Eremiobacteraeota bacterium]|nr:GDP-mannose 4,6-dehydratase [Candidatus Eremiobacteraeota bacterium]MBV8498131.1 GDP-mannose 4,6-dehydratase [Candidatus Eremiobacteraeota bacterium]